MNVNDPIFQDEAKAREYLEAQIWPDGPICPHCKAEDVTKLHGAAHRVGVHQCNVCREQFTVTVGSIFERSKVPLTKWLLAVHLLCGSKKGMSAHQLHRMLGLTYKTAWFMAHRIRKAMEDENVGPMGGHGKTIQADETYYGNTSKRAKGYKKGLRHKQQIVALVEAGGIARAFHVKGATADQVRHILVTNVDRKTTLSTDESRLYFQVGAEFASHKTVNHTSGEYVSPEGFHTNNVENFFGIFKRGMVGVYHKCDEQHLQRYITEFAFRYSNRHVNDTERATLALKGASGKRLMYRRIDKATNAETKSASL